MAWLSYRLDASLLKMVQYELIQSCIEKLVLFRSENSNHELIDNLCAKYNDQQLNGMIVLDTLIMVGHTLRRQTIVNMETDITTLASNNQIVESQTVETFLKMNTKRRCRYFNRLLQNLHRKLLSMMTEQA